MTTESDEMHRLVTEQTATADADYFFDEDMGATIDEFISEGFEALVGDVLGMDDMEEAEAEGLDKLYAETFRKEYARLVALGYNDRDDFHP